MGLLDSIKSERAEKSKKKEFKPDISQKINYLVNQSHISDFEIESWSNYEPSVDNLKVFNKDVNVFPPFFLVEQDQYNVTKKLMDEYGSAYLEYINS
ncbi:hypothetical protein ACFL1H_03570, partial [Nanoarchaeota archaeon]